MKKNKNDEQQVVGMVIRSFPATFRRALTSLREAREQFASVAETVESIAAHPDFASHRALTRPHTDVANGINVAHAIEVLDELIATTEASIPESRAKRAARKRSEGFRRELEEGIRSRTVVREVTS